MSAASKDEKCYDVDTLKKKISKLEAAGNEKIYLFDDEYAIKKTADEVREELYSLQDTLDISVQFNE